MTDPRNRISNFEHYRRLFADIERVNDFPWSDWIPVDGSHSYPDKAGIILLFKSKNEIIKPSTSYSIARRLTELLEDKEQRYKETSLVRYALEEDYSLRFSRRTDINHLIDRIKQLENLPSYILEDQDIRDIEEINRIQAYPMYSA